MPTPAPITGRTCAICHKPGGTAMTLLLRWLGIKGNYAHADCVMQYRRTKGA